MYNQIKSYNQFLLEIYHPQKDGKRPVNIEQPHTDKNNFSDKNKISTITPESTIELITLHGKKFNHWNDAPINNTGWNNLSKDQLGDFEELEFKVDNYLKPASGAIIIEPDNRVWVIHPTNQFPGDTEATFPKGKLEKDLSLKANAIKEAFEESGLKIKLTGWACDSKRTTSITRYYFAERIGGHPKKMGWESQAVSLVPYDQLDNVLNLNIDKKIIPIIREKLK